MINERMKELAGLEISEIRVGEHVKRKLDWHRYDSFTDFTKFTDHEMKKFVKNWQKIGKELGRDYKVMSDDEFDFGADKKDKKPLSPQWRYDKDEMRLYHAIAQSDIFNIYNGRFEQYRD